MNAPGARVWVAMPFHDEIDHLQAQVELLRYHVDGFIVVEGTHTHQGDPKPLHLDGVDLPDNVVRCVADLSDYDEPWARERAQRDYIGYYVRACIDAGQVFDPDDIVVSVDVDEHLNPDAVKFLAAATEAGPVFLRMRMFYYGLAWEDPNPLGWVHPRAMRARDLPRSLSALRESEVARGMWGAGWHVSYTGGPQRRSAKLRAFAHAEKNTPADHARMAIAHETGIGPNGEQLVPVTDLEGVPEALVRRFAG